MADPTLRAAKSDDVAIRPPTPAFLSHADVGILTEHINVFNVIKICHAHNVVEVIQDLVAQPLHAVLPPIVNGRRAATDFLDQR